MKKVHYGLMLGIAVIALFLAASTQLQAETYVIDSNLNGEGRVTGFIETNGTIGPLPPSAMVDWVLRLENFNSGSEVTLTGPLSGNNSTYQGEQLATQFLEASATQIFFRTFDSAIGGVVRFCEGSGCTPLTPDWLFENENGTPGGQQRIRAGTPDAEVLYNSARTIVVGNVALFVDGFESGNTLRWSSETP